MCGYEHCGMPKCCKRRCVGTFTTQYRVYENCCYEVMKVCPRCGCEFEHHQHHCCPKCGMTTEMSHFDMFQGRAGREYGRSGFHPDFEEDEE